jgi:hypothetical protein
MCGNGHDHNEEVDGVAGLVPPGPAPVAVFDDETEEGGYAKVVCMQRCA